MGYYSHFFDAHYFWDVGSFLIVMMTSSALHRKSRYCSLERADSLVMPEVMIMGGF